MKVAQNFLNYQIIATGDGEKLEKWGDYTLLRPDPQVIWHASKPLAKYDGIDAIYNRVSGGGNWIFNKKLPQSWLFLFKDLKFIVKPMGFKHTGVFPEQAINWEFMAEKIKDAKRPIKVLNLFAYTGCASVALAKAGASVVHVDASKGMTDRAKENAKLNSVTNIRFIVDDCAKFVEREIRRGNFYDAVVMDPPSYGRGPNGEMWKLEDNLFDFVCLVKKVCVKNPLFVLINSYTTGLQPIVLSNILCKVFGTNGKVFADEIGIKTQEDGIILPCGASGYFIS